jgi:hypothetical protein
MTRKSQKFQVCRRATDKHDKHPEWQKIATFFIGSLTNNALEEREKMKKRLFSEEARVGKKLPPLTNRPNKPADHGGNARMLRSPALGFPSIVFLCPCA